MEPIENTSTTILRLLLIRISVIGLYLAAFKNIGYLTSKAAYYINHPTIPLLFVCELKNQFDIKIPVLKTFTLLLLFSTTLIPILRALFVEIDTDTIFLWFSLCQIVFCIDSVKTSILNNNKNIKKRFLKTDVIPLEESILIPLKIENNGVFGNIAALIGFLGTFSRITDNTQVLVLLAIGFFTYLFVPKLLEKRLVHLSFKKLIFVLSSFLIFLFISDLKLFVIFSFLLIGVFLSIILMIKLI